MFSTRWSPKMQARLAGIFYLYIVVAGVFAEAFVRGPLVNYSDASATAANILGSESLYRIGLTAEILMMSADIAVAAIFYILFKSVDRTWSLIGMLLRLATVAVAGVKAILLLTPLVLLSSAPYLAAFDIEQLQALSLASIKLHGRAYDVALIAFGLDCLVIGGLIIRSTFLPRLIGIGI